LISATPFTMLIDLHRHLEGSHSPEALAQIAEQFDVPAFREGHRVLSSEEISDRLIVAPGSAWNTFYETMMWVRQAYVSLDAIEELTYQAFVDAAKEADAFEMRFSLASITNDYIANTGQEEADYVQVASQVLEAVIRGRERAGDDNGLRFGLTRFHKSLPHVEKIYHLGKEYHQHLCGLDVMAKEDSGDLSELVPMIEDLREYLPDLTIHAGELLGPEAIYQALTLKPNGLGHGIRAVEDESLLHLLAEAGLTLEICQTSNEMLVKNTLDSYREPPLVTLMRYNIRVGLGTDDPFLFGTTLPKEYEKAGELGLPLETIQCQAQERFAQYL